MGVFLGTVLSFGRILLSHGLPINETAQEPDIIVSDYTQEFQVSASTAGAQASIDEYTLIKESGERNSDDKYYTIEKDSINTDFAATNSLSTDKSVKDTRQVLTDQEAEQRLAELALSDPDIAEIYAHRAEYPEDL